MAKEPRKVGRPSKYDATILVRDVVLRSVEAGFSQQAAVKVAGIAHSTLDEWRDKYPDYAAKFDEAKSESCGLARSTLLTAMSRDEDTDAAKFWLRHRDPEFVPKSEMKTEHSGSINTFSVDWSKYNADEKTKIREVLELLERGRE